MKQLAATLLTLCSFAMALTVPQVHAEGAKHKVVYQCSGSGEDYYNHILFSVAELKAKYGDDIDIVVSCFGPGLHLLGKQPGRKVPEGALDKMVYLDTFGVKFHACGNTMKALGWTKEDLHDFVEEVPIGAEDLMLLQEQGYQYLNM